MTISQNGPGMHGSIQSVLDDKPQHALTFADAYLLRKAKEADAKHRKDETRALVSNMEEFQHFMNKISNEIQGGAPLKHIKKSLQMIPANFNKLISDWYDDDGLNLLHNAIIYDRPPVVTFLLVETNFFPARHSPPLNPYAHLAAMTGHIECLRVILQHRPSFFFAADKPSHAVRLPEHILRKLRRNEKPGTPRAGRLLEKIKLTKKAAEKKQLQLQDHSETVSDVTDILDRDMGDMDKSFKNQKKQLRLHPLLVRRETRKLSHLVKKEIPSIIGPDMGKDEPPREIRKKSLVLSAPVMMDTRRLSTSRQPDSSKMLQRKTKLKPALDRNHFIRRLNPTNKGHLITVFWDVALLFDQGVVQGAGDPITVQYAPDSHLKPEQSLLSNVKRLASDQKWPGSHPKKTRDPVKKPSSTTNAHIKMSERNKPSSKKIDYGVRSAKRLKEFQLKLPSKEQREKDEQESYMNKTPLSYAAEKGYEDCVQLILEMVVVKRNPTITASDPLTLATKARSPETIVLLIEKIYSREDYQNAVLLSIREMLPDCLTALLSKIRSRRALFEGVNLFHILFSQCVISGNRYELMPEMTQTLVTCKEDVNAHNVPMTFPMYTLINCAFNITVGKQIFFFIECLHILLENKANPHFDEEKQNKYNSRNQISFNRKGFSSAINCVFESAKNSVNFFEKSYWSKTFMKKFLTTIEMHDRTPRRVLNNVLFEYMDAVCELGLDRTIVRCLLRYGANPDHVWQGKYSVNVYFDNLLPYLTRFEVINSYDHFKQELDTLMIICKNMGSQHLGRAMIIFLQDHLLSAPIQALPITRHFAACVDHLVRNPRPLSELAARVIWLFVRRSKVRLQSMPWSQDCINMVLP
ncbi:hypothetical protein ElyMa_002606300 [Elysia marginata]|uniref:Uncharacterized protein n=1 Tax=Elysia marginata TaxID=1093978 RepID=A0AAV4H357_9GAST|nr:hypothetical protein ElyMa_002606300 [Elysia marginata]